MILELIGHKVEEEAKHIYLGNRRSLAEEKERGLKKGRKKQRKEMQFKHYCFSSHLSHLFDYFNYKFQFFFCL